MLENADEILKKFSSLTSKQMTKVHAAALRRSLNIGKQQTVKNLRRTGLGKKRTDNGGKPLSSGIKVTVKKDGSSGKIHIMGQPVLKIFETGTYKSDKRKTRKGYNRGKIKAYFFFKDAMSSTETKMIDSVGSEIAKETEKKFKG